MDTSESLELAKQFLGKTVKVVVERPKGSRHPQMNMIYGESYGYIEGTNAPDGEELDVYYLSDDVPTKEAEGVCIAIVHRLKDDDDKLVVVPKGTELTDEQIEERIRFQEQWFTHKIVR